MLFKPKPISRGPRVPRDIQQMIKEAEANKPERKHVYTPPTVRKRPG